MNRLWSIFKPVPLWNPDLNLFQVSLGFGLQTIHGLIKKIANHYIIARVLKPKTKFQKPQDPRIENPRMTQDQSQD